MLPQPGKNKTNNQKKRQKTKQDSCLKASYTAKARVTASPLFTATVTSSTRQQRREKEKCILQVEKMRGSARIAHRKERHDMNQLKTVACAHVCGRIWPIRAARPVITRVSTIRCN